MEITKRAATKTLCLGAIALSLFAACRVDTNGLKADAHANTFDASTALVPDSRTPLDSAVADRGGAPETASPVDTGAMRDGLAPTGGIPAGGNCGGTGGAIGSAAGSAPATGGTGGMPIAATIVSAAAGADQAGSRTAQAGGTAGSAGFSAGGTGGQGGSGSSLGGSAGGGSTGTAGAGGTAGQDAGLSSFGGSAGGGSTGTAGAGGTAGRDAGLSSAPVCDDPTGRKSGSEILGPAGAIAYYPCEPTANPNELSDLSRQSGTAMLISGPRPPLAPWFRPGKVCGALLLSPEFRSYVRLPSGLLSHASEATIASWVYVAHPLAHQRIFDFGENTDVYMFLTSKHFFSGRLSFAITQRGPSSGAEQTVEGPQELPAGEWSHVAVVLGASGAILYVNGVEVAANPGVVLRPKDLGALSNCFVGHSQFPNDPYFDGSIDEFRVYARALTASEIKRLATPP